MREGKQVHRSERARQIIEHVRALTSDCRKEFVGPPPGSSSLITLNPRCQAIIVTGLRTQPGAVASSKAEALLRLRVRQANLSNRLDLWMDKRRVMSAEFDQLNVRVILWVPSDWEQLLPDLVPELA
jgi:hypothetical protein